MEMEHEIKKNLELKKSLCEIRQQVVTTNQTRKTPKGDKEVSENESKPCKYSVSVNSKCELTVLKMRFISFAQAEIDASLLSPDVFFWVKKTETLRGAN